MFNMKYTITITNKMYEELWYYGKRNNLEVDNVASKAIALIALINQLEKQDKVLVVRDNNTNQIFELNMND